MVNVRQEGAVDVRELDSIVDRIAVNRDCRETLSRRCNRSRLVRAAQKREIALRGRRYRGQPYVILAAPGGQSRRQRPYAKHQTPAGIARARPRTASPHTDADPLLPPSSRSPS